MRKDLLEENINNSDFISRDLSWLKFNYRVLDQAKDEKRSLFERLKFLAISASNLDEFFTIRVGSLYNYIDFNKKRIDYSELRELPFRSLLLKEAKKFVKSQIKLFEKELMPKFSEHKLSIILYNDLTKKEKDKVGEYFIKFIYPMLTPTIYDSYHAFPLIRNKSLVLGTVTNEVINKKEKKNLSFVQIPKNLPSFYEIESKMVLHFYPLLKL